MTNDTRAAFEAWMDEPVDLDIAGNPIHRRSTFNQIAMMYAEFGFTAGHAASRRAALAEAAKVCEEHAKIHVDGSYEQGEAEYLAEAIRALADEGVKL